MLAHFFAWWTARIAELIPASWSDTAGPESGIVIEVDRSGHVTASEYRRGRQEPLTLGAAARIAGRKRVVLRPPPDAVLEKQHIVPTASRRDMDQMLRHELARITPFKAEELFWRWDARARPNDKTRTDITLTMVPRAAMAHALDVLAGAGIQPGTIAAGPAQHPRMLAIQDEPASRGRLTRGLAWACGVLALVALILPVVQQEIALRSVNAAITDLQPTIAQVEALRRGLAAGDAKHEVLAKQMQQTGDLLEILATITRILPDDTYLTDFALRQRQLILGGRSAAAARLIAALSADPAIHDAAFAAPVTRIEGATVDVFSIRADIVP